MQMPMYICALLVNFGGEESEQDVYKFYKLF